MFRRRKGQSTLEYAVLISVIVGGLVAMQYYVKRGYEGKLKSSSDDMGEQYDPNAYHAGFTINQHSDVMQTVANGETTTKHNNDQVNSKTGDEHVDKWQ